MRKIAIIAIFQPLLNLSENWLLVALMTHLSRIHEKRLNLSCPQ